MENFTSTVISVSLNCLFQSLKKPLKFVQDLLEIVLPYLSTRFSKVESTASVQTYVWAMKLHEIKMHIQHVSNADISLFEQSSKVSQKHRIPQLQAHI